MKRLCLLLALPVLLGVGGCSHVLSREALLRVDKGHDFAAVKADPEGHRGATLILGGAIVAAKTDREGSELEVVRYLVDRWGEPRRADPAAGRFLAVTADFLDPELYRPGVFVTLTGTVTGSESRDLRGAPYRYPVFTIGEIHPWWREATGYLHGGVYYYGPYPYFDPWWPYRPYWGPSRWRYDPYWPRQRPQRHWDEDHNGD